MFLKKFFLTGMAVLLSVSFILTGCPTDSEEPDDSDDESKSGNTAIVAVSATGVAATEGNNKLEVTPADGTVKNTGLKVYVSSDGATVLISLAANAPTGYVDAAAATGSTVATVFGSGKITVTGLDAADDSAAANSGVINSASTITVTLAADAQDAQVSGITATLSTVTPPPAITDVSATGVAATAGDNKLEVTPADGTVKDSGLKVYVSSDGATVLISLAASAPSGYVAAAASSLLRF
jgi:hypothetical protein